MSISPRVSFALRFAAMPILIGLVILMEAKCFFPFFRVLTFIFVFLLLADLASLLRGKMRDVSLTLASLAFGVSLVEAAANVLEPKELVISTYGWSVRRPVLGWGPEHAGRFHSKKTDPKTGTTIYNVDYTIDSNLLRQTQSCEAGPTIVFFGCSFTFGEGLNDTDTLPQSFANSLDRKERVLNMGFSGYGPQHFLRELQFGLFDTVIGSEPKLFIFMTAAWHAERTACKPYWMRYAPRYVLEKGQTVFKGDCYEGVRLQLREWLENSASYRLFIAPLLNKVSRDDVEFYIRIVLEAVRLAKQKYGVETLIPYLRQLPPNYLDGTGFDNDSIMKRLRDGGAIVMDISLTKNEAVDDAFTIHGDHHPTALANRLRASLLRDYVERHMSGVLRLPPK
ncbi:MAG TPA: SGNH/GDSL hydrolase family protein [Methylocella sp.]|nr:SGNH/GDSL hydrolase family protein [Methylocella sp.]